jgi:hypothetical protein
MFFKDQWLKSFLRLILVLEEYGVTFE